GTGPLTHGSTDPWVVSLAGRPLRPPTPAGDSEFFPSLTTAVVVGSGSPSRFIATCKAASFESSSAAADGGGCAAWSWRRRRRWRPSAAASILLIILSITIRTD
ncbi:hypothetical protein Vafri_4847, partial [Volvox africanus]